MLRNGLQTSRQTQSRRRQGQGIEYVDQLYQSGIINAIDRAFAEMIHRRLGGIDPWVAVAAGLVSRAAASGDVCLDLATVARDGFQAPDSSKRMPIPISLEQWLEKLSATPAVGFQCENKPMILDGNRIYLQRYWKYENGVAQGILQRCTATTPPTGVCPHDLSAAPPFSQGDDDQQRAVQAALTSRFTVISGGPGTGKTFTIARIIQALQHWNSGCNLRVKLAAPTGKAAARLQEALDQAFEALEKNRAPIKAGDFRAQTIHRLLGAIPGTIGFRHNAANPLSAEVVIVDEASMVDLALMAKLIQAVPASCRLILVGDKDQLASVEAGAVLGDICWGLNGESPQKPWAESKSADQGGQTGTGTKLSDHIVILKKSYRFNAQSGIEALGAAVNAGDGERAISLLESDRYGDIMMARYTTGRDMENALERLVMEKIAPLFDHHDPQTALQQLNTLKILTPLRKGPLGVEALNHWVEQILARHGVIDPARDGASAWYSGRPVMITCNDYYHRLFNGDVGITFDTGTGRSRNLQVLFAQADQTLKPLAPEQLPAHETVYAMTVHKSQGTEFEKVLLVLPEIDVPLLTRELVYTAVTRARRQVEIWGDPGLLEKAVSRRIRRASGLHHILWPQA